MTEEWRSIPRYVGLYEASNLGRIRSIRRVGPGLGKTGVTLRPHVRAKGHLQVNLSRNARRRTEKVHRLVLETFVGPAPAEMVACHGNGNPADNRLSNLRWDSRSSNHLDSVSHGTHYNTAKSHCPQGHRLTEPNIVSWARDGGTRACLACARARASLQKRPQDDLQTVSDKKYRQIMSANEIKE
jgi:hypothetical protein